MNWKFSKTIKDGEPYLIQNINIWSKQWNNTGEKINIKDPIYNQNYIFDVYEINNNGKKIIFSAGEFSNNIWGIYEPENIKSKNKVSIRGKLFISGIILLLSSILMLIFGAGMFVSRGDYSKFIIKLSEFCFIFWIPFLIIGISLMLVSIILTGIKSSKTKKQ
ncbi:hypothetical protein [Chryseobacterium sp. POL2]|uniref:hypothetical protein n=1 Tax=Chryseobacterium sp. POL2 TaxID=2713414 RepID=UPI0016265271|nr:hypothetical protein [Chryseobacterium sp. POL2]